MASFDDLPIELVTDLFSYLPRKDRISCLMVCSFWKAALNTPSLWKNIVVYLDSDLVEPSTVIATKLYHSYFKSMEFCWSNPRLPTRWIQYDCQEFAKRACRYLILLQSSLIQLESVKLDDWYEVPKFKKVIYHLCKFLKSQQRLKKVCFFNVTFNKPECIKLLSCCLSSFNTLKYLDISNCYHSNPAMYEAVAFLSCLEHLSQLKVLKLDYTTLCGGVIDCIIISKNCHLDSLIINLTEFDHTSVLISDNSWLDLQKQCPNIKVSLFIKNICHFENIRKILNTTIPLHTFSLTCGKVWDQKKSREYRKTLGLLIDNYYKTLESVSLHMMYNNEFLDDLLLVLMSKCVNLKHLNFHGIVRNMNLLAEICKMQARAVEDGFKFFHVIPNEINLRNHYMLSKLHRKYSKALIENGVDFKICNAPTKNMVYVYY